MTKKMTKIEMRKLSDECMDRSSILGYASRLAGPLGVNICEDELKELTEFLQDAGARLGLHNSEEDE